jgi:STE24 endopeptidase
MLYYLVFLLGSVVVLVTGMYYYLLPFLQEIGDALVTAYPSLPPSIGALFGPDGTLSGVPMVLIVLAYIFLVFGCVSRQCERQADVFGCRAVSCQDAACEGHSDNLTLPAKGKGLCVTGIRTFIRALDKVALVNGIDREHPGFFQSWQHSTIAKRVRFLRGMITDPDVEPTFQKRLWLLKAGLLMGIGALLAAMGMVHGRMW